MKIIRRQCFARAGLLGNPSDGYNGKTISVIVRNFAAQVILYEWEEVELLLSQEDHSRFDSIDQLVDDVSLHGYYGGIRLVKATIKRFAEFCASQRKLGRPGFELHDDKFAVRYESNIPRQVGLAGSSAIIVATLRALMEFYSIEIPQRLQPSLVLSVERDELGIAAGLQDRVIQVYGGAVYMDFARDTMTRIEGFECGEYESLDLAQLPNLYLAYSTRRGSPTEALHVPLRARYEAGEERVIDAMDTFAGFAAAGRDLIRAGRGSEIAKLIDSNFDLRREMCTVDGKCELPANHIQMIEVARRVGASAKFAGSGGAIIGTYVDEQMFAALRRELSEIDCLVIKPDIG